MTNEISRVKELLLALIRGLDEKITLLVNSQTVAVKTAMDAAEKAVIKAENAANERFKALNELRDMAGDWREEFARQATVDLQIKAINEKADAIRDEMNAINTRLSELVARGSGRHDIWGYLVGGIATIAALIVAMIAIITRASHA